jgi:hypothetical protein
MKIIKISNKTNKKIKNTNYSVFQLIFKTQAKMDFLYNTIRRFLIKKIMRFQTQKMNNKNKFNLNKK